MANDGFELLVDYKALQDISERTISRLGQVVRKVAFDIKEGAQRRIREHDLIDTGAMLNNVEVLDYREDEGFSKEVVFGQSYAGVHEFGRTDGLIPAKPFLRPSVEENRKPFEDATAQVLSGD